jgi:hypothetical protein
MKIRAGSFSLSVDLQALGLFALGLVWRLVVDVSKELLTNWRLQLSAGVAAAVVKALGWL